MISDPTSVTVAGTATSLPRVGSGPSSGSFSNPDGTIKLNLSHAYGRRTRRNIRLDFSKVSADPLLVNQNVRSSMSVYVVVDTPVNGFSQTEINDRVKALVDYLSASTYANVSKLTGGES